MNIACIVQLEREVGEQCRAGHIAIDHWAEPEGLSIVVPIAFARGRQQTGQIDVAQTLDKPISTTVTREPIAKLTSLFQLIVLHCPRAEDAVANRDGRVKVFCKTMNDHSLT